MAFFSSIDDWSIKIPNDHTVMSAWYLAEVSFKVKQINSINGGISTSLVTSVDTRVSICSAWSGHT